MTILGCVATTSADVLVAGMHRRFSQLPDRDRMFLPYIPTVAAVTVLAALIGLVTALVLFRS